MNSLRREEIKRYIERKGIVSLKELAVVFSSVSLMTIHRDLDFLEDEGTIIRMRGGAKYVGEYGAREMAFDQRAIENKEAKEIIAKKAASFVKTGSSIFLDAGTTMLALAREVPDVNVSVLTSAPNIAMEVAKKPNPTISLVGGTLNRTNMTLSGSSATDMISKVNVDVAFLVASGYSSEGGFTCGREGEAEVKMAIVKKARTTIMLMDRSKLDKMLPFTFAELSDINYFITDGPLPDGLVQAAKKAEVKLL